MSALPPVPPALYASTMTGLQGASLGEAMAALARCAALVSAHTTNPSAALRLLTDRAAAELCAQMRARAELAQPSGDPHGHA